jgi:hypothetical protein
MCQFYRFQRGYFDKLKELGIVKIRKFPTTFDIAEEGDLGEDATSVNLEREKKVEAKVKGKKKSKVDGKVEDLMWRFNVLMFAFAVFLGCVFMYLISSRK